MSRFDTLQQASFNGIKFPVDEIEVRGSIRDHVHEYPHSPGGTPEKEGRKLYEIDLVCPFHDTFVKYPGLYPDGLALLRSNFENETTATLVVPTIGSIKAYAMTWTQRATGKQRSGERVTLKFREDQPPDDLDAFILSTSSSVSTLSAQSQRFKLAAADGPQPQPSIFDDLQNAVNAVLAIKDTGDRYGNLLEAKLLAVVSLCNDIDNLQILRNPSTFRIAYAMQDMWKSALESLKDIAGKKRALSVYITRTTVAISDVAKTIYGNAARSMELLQLNPIEDAFAIPANTSIRYYADT
jgi:prophage DNA circulation protein